ncbi:MAG: hypothetical protein ACO3UU_17655, partial [Minisyncoccia bacterium]
MASSNNELAKQYQRKTDKQHILDNPDTYIGSVENVDSQMWVYDDASDKIVLRDIEYIPGLYKLFDEGIVNCRDHVIRMIHSPLLDKKFVTYIETNVDENGTITMCNDGNGIDIAKHPEYDIWIPEMVFGHLRTSTNYNKEYSNNLDTVSSPIITKVPKTTKPYTKVSFRPDYRRLGIQGLTSDMVSLLKKRVFDIGAVTDHSIKKIKVMYNNTQIPVKNFQQYIDLYIGSKDSTKRVYESTDERWEYAVALS